MSARLVVALLAFVTPAVLAGTDAAPPPFDPAAVVVVSRADLLRLQQTHAALHLELQRLEAQRAALLETAEICRATWSGAAGMRARP